MSASTKRNMLRSTLASIKPRGLQRDRSKPLAPLSSIEKVERSWQLVSSDLESLGIDFFIRVFLDVPAAMDLFLGTVDMTAEEMEEIKESHVAIMNFVKENRMIKAHARLVIMEVGRCVAGLYDMTVLVPRLRSLGRMHKAAGIQPEHYAIFFKHLMATVKEHMASKNVPWDDATEEAWVNVKDCMNSILCKPDGSAGSWDGGAGMNRWSGLCAAASLYACMVTPLRVAGMVGYESVAGASFSFWDWITSFQKVGSPWEMMNNFGFAFLDVLVCFVFLTELILGQLLRLVKVKDLRKVRNISSRKFQRADMFGKGILILRWLGIHESVTFPVSNVIFLLSYLIQYQDMSWFGLADKGIVAGADYCQATGEVDVTYHVNNGSSLTCEEAAFQSTPANNNVLIVGVHWTWAFGILRLVTILRAMNAIRRMELTYTINRHADSFTRLSMRVTWLVGGLAYTSHVAACLYVLVARIELGPKAYYDPEHPEELATTFFPDHTILGKENGILTNYLRTVHFAFTNLAGIGNHDSQPVKALECMFTLLVNALGATLYAFTTGLLLSMIEPAAERANQFGEEAAALTEYMTEVGMDANDQDRVIQGFILNEMSGGRKVVKGNNDGPFAPAPGMNCTAPAYPQELIQNLPKYLQDELHTVAIVDAMKRRERAFRRCSNEFLTALASSMKQSVTLLPGDYIVREGQNVPTQLLIVEKGSLEVIIDGNYVRTFERGDMISFHWVDSLNRSGSILGVPTSSTSSSKQGSSGGYSPLLLSDAVAGASVRAMDHCKIATGFSSKDEKKDLRKKFPSDWRELTEVIETARGSTRPKRKTTILGSDPSNNAVPIAITNSLHNDGDPDTVLDSSSHGRRSIGSRVRRVSQMVTHPRQHRKMLH